MKVSRRKFINTMAGTVVVIILGVIICGCSKISSKNIPAISLDEKIGKMLMIGFRGLSVDDNSLIVNDIRKYKIGGVILFDRDVAAGTTVRNIQSADQVRSLTGQLQKYAGGNLLIAIDQEGGRITRLKEKHGFAKSLSHKQLGIKNDLDYTYQQASEIAASLADVGVNMNMAPVVDLAINPDCPVITKLERSFSANPAIVVRNARAYIKAHHDKGVICCLKHFPGHGSSAADSHIGVTDVSDTWSEVELTPYKELIASGDADAIMTGHLYNSNLDGDYPATLSQATLIGILRNQLNYKGVIISDDLQMGAIAKEYGFQQTVEKAVLAGVDILLFANNSVYDPEVAGKTVAVIKDMIKKGIIDEQRIDQSYQRIMEIS